MYLAYSFVLSLILIPTFIIKALAHGKYLTGLRQRLGFIPPVSGTSIIWLHCVSVGETMAAQPLVQRLKEQFPRHSLVISTTTPAGQNLARDLFARHAASIFYFPVDWRWCVRRSLKTIKPTTVIIMETERWPNFFRECKLMNIPLALVNGRISEQSYRKYLYIRSFAKQVFSCLTAAVMQTEEDADRLHRLGLPREKLFTAGNLKFDVQIGKGPTEELKNRFALDSTVPLIIAASTHPPEEKIILESFTQLITTQSVRLMLVPRHAERFDEVAGMIQKSGLSWARRTSPPAPTDNAATVVLLDTIGELHAAFPLAQIVFVGGSLMEKGGHNVVEPAAAGVAVVTGPHTHNFQNIIALMKAAGAIIQLHIVEGAVASRELSGVFARLLENRSEREELGRRAKQLVLDNQGTADRTLKIITPAILAATHTS
ncbi:MAG TPA: 3-deoxy-D-manno-octulosonic acid transferase [Pyrinomonadaceae bacterium]|nr:3-deoxy-D-manno-octulosonic acid transferase [Pyrinomonadaceae bacterium]